MFDITEDASGDLKQDFLQEINLMKKVAEGGNPFVVNMIGCCTTEEPLALIMEFVSGGNLLEFLKAHRRKVCTVMMYVNSTSLLNIVNSLLMKWIRLLHRIWLVLLKSVLCIMTSIYIN